MKEKQFLKNQNLDLIKDEKFWSKVLDGKWVKHNTAIVVYHGIGNQLAIETLDLFCRNFAEAFQEYSGNYLNLSQRVIQRTSGDGGKWFDNYIRIENQNDADKKHIDIYEYYWANLTNEKSGIMETQKWIRMTAKGCNRFYKKMSHLGIQYSDSSIFFNRFGNFRKWLYTGFLSLIGAVIPVFFGIISFILKLISLIPFIGSFASKGLQNLSEEYPYLFNSIISDIAIYNEIDNKSKFYEIRKAILGKSVEYLINLFLPVQDEKQKLKLQYEKILVAGHSLGSQIAYDTINRLNVNVQLKQLNGFDEQGYFKDSKGNFTSINEIFCGFVSFGSPLDKIAFFLEQKVEDKNYLWTQILENYHCFKQRNWNISSRPFRLLHLKQPFDKHLFDDILWKNYYDDRDYVSGSLDYYEKLTNINCKFGPDKLFTHSYYWSNKNFYADLIYSFLK